MYSLFVFDVEWGTHVLCVMYGLLKYLARIYSIIAFLSMIGRFTFFLPCPTCLVALQPIFENYMHSRAAAERMDALDQLIYRSRSKKAAEAAKAHVSRVQVLQNVFYAHVGFALAECLSHCLWTTT